ncbi:hypothetical protein VL4N_00130 [Vagococcus lutrae]|uniref:LPXTG cell wall anchor domain-containing protein n=1 Tax=Vagococcus lutrae TaxID=81947 RepID=UPI0019263476|nr:LPXTG cell wall anchor domain-containing protein [Vagococcus lutrae]GEQ60864.1 hypothetical protein VL2N_02000 [Vagococcus lutrae]GEQ62758.1 hypothetical protein VL3N_02000 [Vagococcus lutrae]GEQ64463.1 hypothetical protein VL4N_00130 [Vagococcus lutrae]
MTRNLRLIATLLIFFIASIRPFKAAEYNNNLSGHSSGGITFIESDEELNGKPYQPLEPDEVVEEPTKELNNERFEKKQNLPQTGEHQNMFIAVAGIIIIAFSILIFRKNHNNRT